MRVTKLIREFVEKEINAAIPTEEKIVYPELYQVRTAAADAVNEINRKVAAYTEQLCEEYRAQLNLPEGWEFKPNEYNMVMNRGWGSKMHDEGRRREQAARKRRQEAIDSILLELELGATKADLLRLIEEATK